MTNEKLHKTTNGGRALKHVKNYKEEKDQFMAITILKGLFPDKDFKYTTQFKIVEDDYDIWVEITG